MSVTITSNGVSTTTTVKLEQERRVHWKPFLVNLHTSKHIDKLNYLIDTMARLFYEYGKFCTSHPWEVILCFVALAIAMFFGPMPANHQPHHQQYPHTAPEQGSAQLAATTAVPGGSTHLAKLETASTYHRQSANSVSHEQPARHPFMSDLYRAAETHLAHCTPAEFCPDQKSQPLPNESESNTETILLTITCGLALFYVYYQLQKMYMLGSKYLAGIAAIFTICCSITFCSSVVKILDGNSHEIIRAIPFFILLLDFSKACLLAQFALSSSNKVEVHENISRGMATLGPSLTLDTLVETLALGMGIMSGVPRLQEISYYACLTIMVNYVVFMTIYPASLSLALELSHDHDGLTAPVWQFATLAKVLQLESEHTPNPVIQRIKMVMSLGLVLVHTRRWWPDVGDASVGSQSPELTAIPKATEWAASEQLIVVLMCILLAVKYIFFDNKDIHNIEPTSTTRLSANTTTSANTTSRSTQIIDLESSEIDSNTSSSTPSSTRPATPSTSVSGSDEIDRKSGTPSILITAQDSDTESMIELRRKINESGILMSSVCSSNASSQASSVKGLCVNHRKHNHTPSSGHGTDNDSLPNSECDDSPDQSRSSPPSFFIGDDFSECCFPEYVDREVQTDPLVFPEHFNTSAVAKAERNSCGRGLSEEQEVHVYSLEPENMNVGDTNIRDMETLKELLKQEDGFALMSDSEVQFLAEKKIVNPYTLESALGDLERGVAIRRRIIEKKASKQNSLKNLPYMGYNYNLVLGACCENVIGYMPVPLGVAGPLIINNKEYLVPMATTEGCLVASTNRGCRAIALSGGLYSNVYSDGMTRGPVIQFDRLENAANAMKWLQTRESFDILKSVFDSTSRFARLQRIHPRLAGRYIFIRFVAQTGDAMGMNMLSKGTELALEEMCKYVEGVEMKVLSGNFCTDKKPSAVNWIEGRGKSVACEVVVPERIVRETLKTNVDKLVQLNMAKNLIGSSVAGSIGGNNAQAANIVAAIYIATGQDPAQTVGSSNCLTLIEKTFEGDLRISCTMPSIEIATIGGGTVLGPQGACLELLGLKGCSTSKPGSNASELAQVVCGTVLAGELSLLSALHSGDLVKSHMKHNRSNININLEASPLHLLGKNI